MNRGYKRLILSDQCEIKFEESCKLDGLDCVWRVIVWEYESDITIWEERWCEEEWRLCVCLLIWLIFDMMIRGRMSVLYILG